LSARQSVRAVDYAWVVRLTTTTVTLIEINDCRSVRRMLIDPIPIKAIQNMLGEVETLIATTTPLPENRTARCLELLQAAKAITNDILKRASRVH
jgi:hypothetical protein